MDETKKYGLKRQNVYVGQRVRIHRGHFDDWQQEGVVQMIGPRTVAVELSDADMWTTAEFAQLEAI